MVTVTSLTRPGGLVPVSRRVRSVVMAMAWPSSSVMISRQVQVGSAAAATARSRAWPGVMGPIQDSSPGSGPRPVKVRQGTVSRIRPGFFGTSQPGTPWHPGPSRPA